MAKLIAEYKKLDASVWSMVIAELIIFTINSAFFTIANIFMSKQGLSDPQIADVLSFRFASTLFFAVPFGVFIRKRKLKPFLYIVAVSFPLAIFLFVQAVAGQIVWLLYITCVAMGLSDSTIRIVTISYILRNVKPENHTAGISLNSACWAASLISSGLFVAISHAINPVFFDEKMILTVLSLFGFVSLFFVANISKDFVDATSEKAQSFSIQKDYKWKRIIVASMPTTLIAIGAGLTIPYVNLFFFHSFGVDSSQFATLMMFVACLVVGSILLVPKIKERFGYRAITYTQTLAVLVLFCMATSDFYQHLSWMIFVAVICFILRQPLMNLAGPMTSEMTMYYVGKESQELMASLTSTIWSGSWFISAIIFRNLRAADYSYGGIFYITVALYVLGITAYHFLILDFEKKKLEGVI